LGICEASSEKPEGLHQTGSTSPHTAFEPLSEPPNCSVGGTDRWTVAQLSLYKQVRAIHRITKFVVYGYHWGDNTGTDFTRLNPTSYAADPNTLYTFHYYDPFTFTAQGLSWMGNGHYKYETGVTWPYDAANANSVLDEALTLVRQDQYLTPDQQIAFEDQIAADLTAYATTGTQAYIGSQFVKIQAWARAYHLSAGQILVGEYGVAQPSHNTLGAPAADLARVACGRERDCAPDVVRYGSLGSRQRPWYRVRHSGFGNSLPGL
jgi:hypothetical protein